MSYLCHLCVISASPQTEILPRNTVHNLQWHTVHLCPCDITHQHYKSTTSHNISKEQVQTCLHQKCPVSNPAVFILIFRNIGLLSVIVQNRVKYCQENGTTVSNTLILGCSYGDGCPKTELSLINHERCSEAFS